MMTTTIGHQSIMVDSSNGYEKRKNCKARSMSRTLELEKAYVHDVYATMASHSFPSTSSPVDAQVKQFMVEQFEPHSVLLDIGCSDGKNLTLCRDLVVVGLEHCREWFTGPSYKGKPDSTHLVVGDVLSLPFRDALFDGVLCCSVLHHLSTLERRVNALQEIARIMKIGGKVMLTVTSGPGDANDLGSQDVLIRLDRSGKALNNTCSHHFCGSDVDSRCYSSSSHSSTSSSSSSSLQLNVYENCASSPTSSELENCYSFVKKALKRFSLTSSIYSMKNSFSDGSSKSKFSTNLSFHDEMYPIELHNLEEDCSSQCSSHSSSTTGDSALSSFNRSSGCISQTSSNGLLPASFLTSIKEHLISWKVQFATSMAWHSLDPKVASLTEDGKTHIFEGEEVQSSHRFSLPTSLANGGPKGEAAKSTLRCKNKVYACNGASKPLLHNFAIDGVVKQVELTLSHVILPKRREGDERTTGEHVQPIAITTVRKSERKSSLTVNSKIIFQKSFSSETSRRTSFECSGYKLIAYYSMPELRTIAARPERCQRVPISLQGNNNHLDFQMDSVEPDAINEQIHEFDREETTPSLQSDSKECLLAEMDLPSESSDNGSIEMPLLRASPASALSDVSKDCELESALADEMKEHPGSLQQANGGKFPKKLLRQRSFSADYQPENVKFQPELPRRFSASPNIGTHRYNSSNHTPHHQQISIDSEESFVTIIPASRSNRDSMADVTYACDGFTDFELEEEEVDMELDDSSDDDAYCESLSNEDISEDDTSISSVLEATIKSVSKSDSKESNNFEDLPVEEEEEATEPANSTAQSPPTTLHRYFHLYRAGELESIIEQHVPSLHIIDSVYNEYATSWCIIAEKIHVWTI